MSRCNKCEQTNVPEVDNTLGCCEDIQLDSCIKITKDLLSLPSVKGTTLDKVLKKITDKLTETSKPFLILTPRVEPTTPVNGMIYSDIITGEVRYRNPITNRWDALNLELTDDTLQ